MPNAPAVLWRRLDTPGHDACRLIRLDDGWRIVGTAIFRDERGVARLDYLVECDANWRTREGHVRGWVGEHSVRRDVVHTIDGVWSLDGVIVDGLDDCIDLDLGFTPATNLLQLRRTALAVGAAADVPVAWLDVHSETLERLEQRYERRDANTYWYEAPRFDYAELLELLPSGFVLRYPRLWEAEVRA